MPRKLAPLALVLAAVALTGLAGCKKDTPEDETAQALEESYNAKRDNVKRALQYHDQSKGWTPKPICAVPPCETYPAPGAAETESKD